MKRDQAVRILSRTGRIEHDILTLLHHLGKLLKTSKLFLSLSELQGCFVSLDVKFRDVMYSGTIVKNLCFEGNVLLWDAPGEARVGR